jgi:hypothetical protein
MIYYSLQDDYESRGPRYHGHAKTRQAKGYFIPEATEFEGKTLEEWKREND